MKSEAPDWCLKPLIAQFWTAAADVFIAGAKAEDPQLRLLVLAIAGPFDQAIAKTLGSKTLKPPKEDCPGYWADTGLNYCCIKHDLNTGKAVVLFCTKKF